MSEPKKKVGIVLDLVEYQELLRRAGFSNLTPENYLRAVCGFPPLKVPQRSGREADANASVSRVYVKFSAGEFAELERRADFTARTLGVAFGATPIPNYLRSLSGFAARYRGP